MLRGDVRSKYSIPPTLLTSITGEASFLLSLMLVIQTEISTDCNRKHQACWWS